jgi:hypothetical protein
MTERSTVNPWAAPDSPEPARPRRAAVFPGANVPPPPAPPPVYPPPPVPERRPSGLFPSTPHPTYREPYPAGGGAVAVGVLAGTVWMALLGVLGTHARGYVWWTVAAGIIGWGAALALARFGDRGVAVGVALACAIGVAISFVVVTVEWTAGHWLLW